MNVIKRCQYYMRRSRRSESGVCGEKLNFNIFGIQTDLQLQQTIESLQGKENIKYIYLNGSKITSIPVSIGSFPNLIELHLNDNEIKFIPWSIILLKKLKILNLSHNKIRLLPTIICYLPSVTELDLSNNELKKLPTELLNLPNIVTLKLASNTDLVSPPLELCLQGKDAIFSALQKRLMRTNLWERWKPYYQENNNTRLTTLMEVCIECILKSDLDFLSATHIPPVMKNYISDIEKMEQFNLLPRLQKCSNCKRYFSSDASFENHAC